MSVYDSFKYATRRRLSESPVDTLDELVATMPSLSLGIPRIEMPQIEEPYMPEFVATLQDEGVFVQETEVPVRDLKPTQNELNVNKVKSMITGAISPQVFRKLMIAASDHYILDGHHRWAALWCLDPYATMPTELCGVEIRDLLRLANGFSKVGHKSVKEMLKSMRLYRPTSKLGGGTLWERVQ